MLSSLLLTTCLNLSSVTRSSLLPANSGYVLVEAFPVTTTWANCSWPGLPGSPDTGLQSTLGAIKTRKTTTINQMKFHLKMSYKGSVMAEVFRKDE
jgi:hypothetical protein